MNPSDGSHKMERPFDRRGGQRDLTSVGVSPAACLVDFKQDLGDLAATSVTENPLMFPRNFVFLSNEMRDANRACGR